VMKTNKGFSLMEMVITIVVLAIISGFSFVFFINLIKTYSIMRDERGIHQEGAYIVERISRELRSAVAVSVPSASEIAFQVAQRMSTDDSKLQDANRYIKYCLSGTDLYRATGASAYPTCPGGSIISKNIQNGTGFSTNYIPGATTANDSYGINVFLTEGSQTIAYSVIVSPKNLPFLSGGSYKNRSFNGDYYDKVCQAGSCS